MTEFPLKETLEDVISKGSGYSDEVVFSLDSHGFLTRQINKPIPPFLDPKIFGAKIARSISYCYVISPVGFNLKSKPKVQETVCAVLHEIIMHMDAEFRLNYKLDLHTLEVTKLPNWAIEVLLTLSKMRDEKHTALKATEAAFAAKLLKTFPQIQIKPKKRRKK